MSTETSTSTSQGSGQVGGALAVGLICLVIGGALGYYTRYFTESSGSGTVASSPPTGGGPPGGGMMGGMGGGFGGGGGGNQPGTTLVRTVRNLATIQKVQSAGITESQAATLLPILEQVKNSEKLSEAEAQAKLDAVNKALTPEQKEALEAMQPFRRGGGGGPGGGRGGPGGPGGPPGGPGAGPTGTSGPSPMGAMGGGMGGRPDPERPFASERNKQALDDLIDSLM